MKCAYAFHLDLNNNKLNVTLLCGAPCLVKRVFGWKGIRLFGRGKEREALMRTDSISLRPLCCLFFSTRERGLLGCD